MLRNALLIISALVLFSSCSETDLPDSNFRIDPIKNPDAALRCFFFSNMQDSIEFYQFGRPAVDTGRGRKFGIRWIPSPGSKDTLQAGYDQVTTLRFDRDSITPSNALITSLHLGFPGIQSENQAYWRFRPAQGAREVKQINLLFPSLIRPGSFPILVGGILEQSLIDSTGKPKKIQVVIPNKTIMVRLK